MSGYMIEVHWSSDEWEDFSDGHSRASNLITYVCRRDARAVVDCTFLTR